MSEFSRESHYVPQSYLRRWLAPGSQKLWAYRTLVPRENLPVWEEEAARSIARRRDFYTSVEGRGKESDRIEKWLNREVESPAQPVLERICNGDTLSQQDRRKLARYIASLDARSPLHYSEYTRLMSEHAEGVLNAVLEQTIRSLTEKLKSGEPLPSVPPDYKCHSIGVELDHGNESEGRSPAVNVNYVIGRESWLDSIENMVNEVSRYLEPHDWRVLRPHEGWTWYSSDHPVVRLRFQSDGQYDLKGRYGDTGTEVMLPLSPTQLLYAQVARSPTRVEALSLQQTYLLKRFIAENAYRWVVAAAPVRHAEWFRHRVVDREQYVREDNERMTYHDKQSQAEIEVTTKRDSKALA